MNPGRPRAWPSSPTQISSSKSAQTHQRQPSDSSDFGAFASAHNPSQTAPQAPHQASLQSGDLLGSFEDLVDLGDSLPAPSAPIAGPSSSAGSHADGQRQRQVSQRRRQPDLMSETGDEVWIELPEEHEAHTHAVRQVAAPPAGRPAGGPPGGLPRDERGVPQPILVQLPPRPDDISPDYVPPHPSHPSPRRMPRRMSQNYLFPGPSSPPALSTVGAELFHPFGETDSPEGILHRQHSRSRTTSSDFALADDKSSDGTDGPPAPSQSPRPHTLLGTLATTAKVASKWKNVLAHPHDHLPQTAPLPVRSGTGPGSGRARESSGDIWGSGSFIDSKGSTALPIEVSHTTPFATPEEVAGTYVPPSGAPGFSHLHEKARRGGANGDEEWERVRLMGRREGTLEVLSQRLADQLRAKLPPRQRIASKWQMLFSLDQHGASLASLYRLVEKHRASVEGRAAANLLAVRDGDDNLFGVFMTDSIQKREGSYYGSGETFMWKQPSGSDSAAGAGDGLEIFKWTGRNQYFALCENTFISFGGGGNSYGLFLDSTFNKNTSATSPAFDNEVLCTADHTHSDRAVRFDCLGLEVWAI